MSEECGFTKYQAYVVEGAVQEKIYSSFCLQLCIFFLKSNLSSFSYIIYLLHSVPKIK